MAKLTLGDKIHRAVDFLLGVVDPRIASLLSPYGFNQLVVQLGWTLVQNASGGRLDTVTFTQPDPSTLDEVDEFENKWFPIAKVTLDCNYPAVSEEVFLNLSQTEGPAVAISVSTLIRRLEALKAEDAGAERTAARALLAERGLTPEVVAAAKALVEKLGVVEEPPEIDLEQDRIDRDEAEEALWKWYLQWSTIARTVIKDKRLLRLLGFRKTRKPKAKAKPKREPKPKPTPSEEAPDATEASADPPEAPESSEDA